MADTSKAYPKGRIALRDVGLRDGLQLTRTFPTTAQKRAWVTAVAGAGVRHFEVGSFLPVTRMPQFADVREVIEAVDAADAHGVALALNQRGASDALATAVPEITVVISASAAHNEANAKRSQAQSLEEIANAVRLRDEIRPDAIMNVGIAMSFGCPLQGDVPEDEVLRIVDACLAAGVDMVGLADTIGFAGPHQVTSLCRRLEARVGDAPYVVHLHDTRGLGMANAAAALDAGCRVLDASLGGLGGCPFAPGATGNIVLEDLVFLAGRMGFATGIDLDGLVAARAIPEGAMPDEHLYGALARSGPPKKLRWSA